METMINLLMIQLIIVFIVDVSGVMDSLKEGLSSLLTKGKIKSSEYRLKPFDCSLCTMFWTGLIYLLCTKHFTIPYLAFVCLLSALTTLTQDIWYTIVDILTKLLNKIDQL